MKGRFITIEGVEGVGKSTNIELTAELIRDAGYDVLVTREPGGTEIGERVRDILLDKSQTRMAAMTELLLMFASRAQHVEEKIRPALDAGTWVISDRFTDSSYAYQGGGRGLGFDTVQELERFALGDFKPDLTLLLDLDVQTGLERAATVAEADRFESEQMAFFETVRSCFQRLSRAESRFVVIDAGRPLEDVQQEVTRAIQGLLSGAVN